MAREREAEERRLREMTGKEIERLRAAMEADLDKEREGNKNQIFLKKKKVVQLKNDLGFYKLNIKNFNKIANIFFKFK